MTEHQHSTINVSGLSSTLSLCLLCNKTFDISKFSTPTDTTQTCPNDDTVLMPLPVVDAPLVGNYAYKGVLGVGGMGVVFKALNPYLDKVVAIKKVKGKRYDAKQLQRFNQEGKLLSKLVHPNLVSVLDFGANDAGEPYMVMEYMDGQSLASLIARSGTIGLPQTLEILSQTCNGLAHAHKFGAVHRDIKPSNIFVMNFGSPQMLVKVLDFGIAKLWFPEDPAASADLTRTGEIFGSPLYMSPEQALGKSVDERSDLYSLGCVMYEMLSGQPPIVGETAMETVFKHVSGNPLPLSVSAPGKKYPKEVQEVLTCLLAKNPADRIESAEQLGEILENIRCANTAQLQQLRSKARSLNLRTTHGKEKAGEEKETGRKLPVPLWIVAGGLVTALTIGVLAFFAMPKAASTAAPPIKTASQSTLAPSPNKDIENNSIDDVFAVNRGFLARELDKGTNIINVVNTELTASDFQLLADKGQNVTSLIFKVDSGLNPAGIAMLHKLPLTALRFEHSDLDDATLVAVTKLSSVRKLTICTCPTLSPKGLIALKQMPDLNLFHIEECDIDPLVLKQVFPMAHLNTLNLRGSDRSVANMPRKVLKCNLAMPEVGRCTNMIHLNLSATDITNDGIKALAPLKRLKTLNLANCTRLGDGAIDTLEKLPAEEFILRGTAITPKGVERLLHATDAKNVCMSNHVGKLSPYLEEQATRGRLSF